MKYRNALLVLLALVIAFPWSCDAQGINEPLADLFADQAEFLKEEDAFQFDFEQRGDRLLDLKHQHKLM